MQVRKQQLELDMEQQTGSKQEKEYIKTVYLRLSKIICPINDQNKTLSHTTEENYKDKKKKKTTNKKRQAIRRYTLHIS